MRFYLIKGFDGMRVFRVHPEEGMATNELLNHYRTLALDGSASAWVITSLALFQLLGQPKIRMTSPKGAANKSDARNMSP